MRPRETGGAFLYPPAGLGLQARGPQAGPLHCWPLRICRATAHTFNRGNPEQGTSPISTEAGWARIDMAIKGWHPIKGLSERSRADQFSLDDGWTLDLSAVSGSEKYWKMVAGSAAMMDQAEIDAVDAQDAADALLADQTANEARLDNERILRASVLVLLKEIERQVAGLAARSPVQILKAIKTRVRQD